MTVRVEVIETIDIGNGLEHETYRRTFTEWPPEAIEAVRKQLEHRPNDLEAALAAALGHITGDNK